MKDASMTMQDLLSGSNKFFVADLLTITLFDPPSGVSNPLRWTGASIGLTTDLGTFSSLGPDVDMGRHRQSSELTVDTRDITLECRSGLTLGGKTLPAQAVAALFRRATVRVDRAFMDVAGDTAAGTLRMFDGVVADPEVFSTKVILHCESGPSQLAVASSPSLVLAAPCPNDLYDTICGVNKATFTLNDAGTCKALSWNTPRTAVLTGLPETTAADIGGMSAPNWPYGRGYYAKSVVTFNAGTGNAGISRTVEYSRLVSGTSQLWFSEPWPNTIAANDRFTLVVGCDKFAFTCVRRFWGQPDYQHHFRGFLDLPPNDVYAGWTDSRPVK